MMTLKAISHILFAHVLSHTWKSGNTSTWPSVTCSKFWVCRRELKLGFFGKSRHSTEALERISHVFNVKGVADEEAGKGLRSLAGTDESARESREGREL